MLLIGKNGAGKSTVREALRILQQLARGTNRVDDLVRPSDLSWGRTGVPLRIEIEVTLNDTGYSYTLALELPKDFRELRVVEEQLTIGPDTVYRRELAQVTLSSGGDAAPVTFGMDWHLAALPIVHPRRSRDEIERFRSWLKQMLILSPAPSLITGTSQSETLEPDLEVKELGAWFAGLIAHTPSAYAVMDQYLREVMPEFSDIRNPQFGPDSRSLIVQFRSGVESLQLPFGRLSDGEKCLLICAMVLASSKVHEPSFCFWDEPDAHLAIAEVGHFVMSLRQAFGGPSQLIMTSHNSEAIRKFSDENTFCLFRKSRLEPTQVRPLSEVQRSGDLVTSLIMGGLEP